MNQCNVSMKKLLSWNGFETLKGLILHGSDGLPCDGEGLYQEFVRHVQNCNSCKSWLNDIVPEHENSRLSRLEKYCCPVMYGAVEYKEEDELHIRLIDFQGDPTWSVMNFNVVGGNLLCA